MSTGASPSARSIEGRGECEKGEDSSLTHKVTISGGDGGGAAGEGGGGRGPLRRAQHEFTFRFRLLWEMKACVRQEKGADGTKRESACEEYIDI